MNRRNFLAKTALAGSLVSSPGLLAAAPLPRTSTTANEAGESTWVDHIPVIWVEPDTKQSKRRLVIWQPWFSATKEQMLPFLTELANDGYIALSFDNWQHGERGKETPKEIGTRVFKQFRRHMWPIIGNSVLDATRVIDWAVNHFDVSPDIGMGGMSMGGDISVATCAIDRRIKCVAATVSTPDWQRPGMKLEADKDDVDQGIADPYARFFYDQLNPLTHMESYAHRPAITFECGADDFHVPPDGALRFQTALADCYGDQKEKLRVSLHEGVGHRPSEAAMWANCKAWFQHYL